MANTARRNLGTSIDAVYEDATRTQRKEAGLPPRVTLREVGNGRTFFTNTSDRLLIKTRSRSREGRIIATEVGTGRTLFLNPSTRVTLPVRAALYVKE